MRRDRHPMLTLKQQSLMKDQHPGLAEWAQNRGVTFREALTMLEIGIVRMRTPGARNDWQGHHWFLQEGITIDEARAAARAYLQVAT